MIELLVVVSIIGLLTALLLPAVQAARESARRTACDDNLRQIGVSLQSHEIVHQILPALYNGAFLPQPRNAIDEFHFFSWRTAILPQLEQTVLFAQININLLSTVAENQTAVNVRVSAFVCPSSSNPTQDAFQIYEWNNGALPLWKNGTAARNDYEAMGGVRVDPQTRSSTDLSIIRFGPWGEPTYKLSTGASLPYRVARLADITDGLSNTILVGERAGRPDFYRKGEPVDPYPHNQTTSGSDPHQAAWAISTHFLWLVFHFGQPINFTNSTGIFSFHPGGANVAHADGSVRFLKETTPAPVLKALATRSGSEAVSTD